MLRVLCDTSQPKHACCQSMHLSHTPPLVPQWSCLRAIARPLVQSRLHSDSVCPRSNPTNSACIVRCRLPYSCTIVLYQSPFRHSVPWPVARSTHMRCVCSSLLCSIARVTPSSAPGEERTCSPHLGNPSRRCAAGFVSPPAVAHPTSSHPLGASTPLR